MSLAVRFLPEQVRASRQAQAAIVLSVLAVLLLCAILASLATGAVTIAPANLARLIAEATGLSPDGQVSARDRLVFSNIRLPRVIAGCAIGATLGLAGAVMQGLFRNPLADPGLIGVSSGAALAAVAVIVVGGDMVGALTPEARPYALPAAAMLGGLLATLLVYRLGASGGQTLVATTLLAGIAVNAVASAGIGFFVFLSDEQQLRELTFWTLGSTAGITWVSLLPALVVAAVPLALLPRLAGPLNAMLLGEREAFHLGFSPERVKRQAIVLGAVAVGAAVSIAGIIGFVGLIVPHIVRLLCGPDHRYVLPGAMVLGAGLFLVADLVARMIVLPAEMPVGVITALIGGPFFIALLYRRKDWG